MIVSLSQLNQPTRFLECLFRLLDGRESFRQEIYEQRCPLLFDFLYPLSTTFLFVCACAWGRDRDFPKLPPLFSYRCTFVSVNEPSQEPWFFLVLLYFITLLLLLLLLRVFIRLLQIRTQALEYKVAHTWEASSVCFTVCIYVYMQSRLLLLSPAGLGWNLRS